MLGNIKELIKLLLIKDPMKYIKKQGVKLRTES